MRRTLYYLLFIAGGIATHVCAGEEVKVGSSTLDNVLFVDGFDGSFVVPDMAVWELCTYAHSTQSQHFKAMDGYENVRVEDGYLKSRAYKDNGIYKGGRVFSRISFPYDIRLKVKARLTRLVRDGSPAIWQVPIEASEWPRGGEIDLMEWVQGTPMRVYRTVHIHHIDGESSSVEVTNKDPNENLDVTEDHIYAVERTEKELVFYVDDKETWRYENQHLDKGRLQYPFCEYTFSIIPNFSLGGGLNGRVTWPGEIHDEDLPGEMQVD